MSAHDNGGPAFPVLQVTQTQEGPFVRGNSGMTLRDYFAAKAMQAIASTEQGIDTAPSIVSRAAFKVADAMLAARKEGGAA